MALGPIFAAGSIPLSANGGTLPNVATALYDYFQTITFEVLTKTILNGLVTETTTPVTFFGVWQNWNPQNLKMEPVGERKWEYRKLHCQPTLFLGPDDVIIWQGIQYRVLGKIDFSQYGYVEYNFVNDYSGAGPVIE
jgi:hypothetical protein